MCADVGGGRCHAVDRCQRTHEVGSPESADLEALTKRRELPGFIRVTRGEELGHVRLIAGEHVYRKAPGLDNLLAGARVTVETGEQGRWFERNRGDCRRREP